MAVNLTTPPEGCFWLASYPKSGNTWVRLFLSAYITGRVDINNIPISHSDVSLIDHQIVSSQPLNALVPMESLYLRYAALMNIIKAKMTNPVILKTHNARLKILDVELIPDALVNGAVYVVRDPRDVCVSYARHMDMDFDTAIHRMNFAHAYLSRNSSVGHYTSTWSENVESWQKATVIRYEDMLADPETEFVKVLETFKIKLNRPRLSKAVKLTEKSKLAAQEKKRGFKECINNTFFYGEKGSLSDIQKRQIEMVHGEWMHKMGYLENGSIQSIQQLRA